MEELYMVTKIISGNVVERRKSRIMKRPIKRGGRIRGNSSEKKVAGNKEYAVLQLARSFNANLHPGDLWLTASFNEVGLAKCGNDLAGAKKEGRKFLDRIAYRLKKQGVELRWWMAPSEIDGETGELVRPHIHLVLTGKGFVMEDGVLKLGGENVEDIWGLGFLDVQFLRHQDDYYPLAKYIINQSRGVPDEKKYTCSRNLAKPIIRREIVTSGSQLRIPSGATELVGTVYDPEKGQNIVRYIPKRRDAAKKIGGHKELARAMEADDHGL